jgi:HPt (histidine-containing phosphotransfer) domain-containing protein
VSDLIDQRQFDSVRAACTPAVFKGLIGTFAEEMPIQLQQIEQSSAASDAGGLLHLAHQMRGFAANFGCVRVAALTAALESACRAEDWPAVRAQIAALQPAARETWREIAHLIAQEGGKARAAAPDA